MAGPYVTGSGSGFPQTSANRTRLQATVELAQYVGGESRGDSLARAGSAWDGSVRAYNSVAWKFNRVTQDIVLDSTMLDNTAPPTVASTGAGTGFVLSTSATIDYWIEERVKDAGGNILKRNFAPLASKVTLTGTGALVKPVITRPALVSTDTTHWALYGTAAKVTTAPQSQNSTYPNGFFLGETVAATTTIEDVRTGNDPAMAPSPPLPILYEPSDFDLKTDFRNHIRAWMIDADGFERYRIGYQPWEAFPSVYNQRLAKTTLPALYTVRNPHEEGKVVIFPRLTLPATWPVLRIEYSRWIALAVGDSDRLNVPRDVDEGIFALATATILSRVRSFQEAQAAFVIAENSRAELEQHRRDWPDF